MSYLDLETDPRVSPVDDVKTAVRPGFRPDIEGLRALAVLLVVLYHCGVGGFGGGFVGVDVFFVISGFLITSQLAREAATTGRVRIGRFYARRALRLLPAATLVLVCTLAAAWCWMPPVRLRAIAGDALAGAGYVLNLRLIQVGNDYRSSGASPSPLQHFWSLAVEEQFYLVIPLLAVLGLVLLRRRAVFAGLLTALVAASFVFSVTSSGTDPVAAYLGAPARAWELGAGALLALALPRVRVLRVLAPPLRWAGLAAIGFGAVTFGETTPFPGWPAAIPVLGALAVLAAGTASPGRTLTVPLLEFIGARSYSWYLWHWPVLVVAPYLLGHEIELPERLLAALVALGLAAVTYSMVEQPLRHHPELRQKSWRAGLLAVGLTVTTVAVALLVPMLPARQTQGEGVATGLDLAGTGPARDRQLSGRLEAAALVTALPRNLRPSLAQARTDDPAIARNGCLVPVGATLSPEHCESLGHAGGRVTVVLFGDSHAAQWYPALNALAQRRNWRLAVFTKLMCTPAEVELYAEQFRGRYETCDAWRQNAIGRIQELRPNLVVMTSIADHMDLLEHTGDPDGTWARGWATTAGRLRSATADLVFLADTPKAKGDVPECLSQNPRDVQACAQSPQRAAGSGRRTRIAGEVASAGARVIDPTPWFCDVSSCPVVVDDTLVYRDDNHITGRYVRTLAPLLLDELVRGAEPARSVRDVRSGRASAS
ncbi:acyltransferase [Kineosporia sp. J2-2]|uniref:Acyltransferase n=1 Tax=Kineosporia corallincola TaxID=2835133 RepID=A0ABS5TR03_9ACTN|nr:acyltransferase family protein [Kineosporia corallincola]MBT0773036.1 acyltransferase [Kineosporia corallincola]